LIVGSQGRTRKGKKNTEEKDIPAAEEMTKLVSSNQGREGRMACGQKKERTDLGNYFFEENYLESEGRENGKLC